MESCKAFIFAGPLCSIRPTYPGYHILQVTPRDHGGELSFYSPYCTNISQAMVWLGTIGTTSAEAFFSLEAYAICGRNRMVLVLICLSSFIVTGTRAVVNILRTSNILFKSDPSLLGCVTMLARGATNNMLQIYSVIYDASVIYSCIVLLNCILYFRRKRFRHSSKSPIVRRVYRGALTFYCLELGVNVVAIILYCLRLRFDFLTVFSLLTDPAVAAIITSRVILDVRDMGAEGCYTTSIYPAKSISTLWFNRPAQSASEG